MSDEKLLDEEALGAVTGGVGDTDRTMAVHCDCGAVWRVPRMAQNTVCPQCGTGWRVNSNGFKVPCYDPE